ncbi:GNAT family N-acetyltransferase [Caproiciproducens sp. LBM24188]
MISKVELPETLSPFADSAFGCRIIATADAYGFSEPFAQIWVQEDKAALCKLDDVMILSVKPGADFEELHSFIRMTGAKILICSGKYEEHTGFQTAQSGEIMGYLNLKPLKTPASYELNPSLRDLHGLLCECETPTFTPPDFEPFYLDLSHRIRHGTALAVGIRQGEALVSCAICSAKTQSKAILSAVACKPVLQRHGYGRAALAALISNLEQRELYIFRARGVNEEFYRSCGFLSHGTFVEQTIA